MKPTLIKKSDILWVDFDPSKGTEIQKKRPALVCSQDVMNDNSSRIIAAPITSNIKKIFSFEYKIKTVGGGEGKIMFDQMRTVDKTRLGAKISHLSHEEIMETAAIIKFVFGLS